MADKTTYGQEQAEKNLKYWQGLSGKMREPSIMASPEEREAYAAQQVRAGKLSETQLPEAYGGMPVGETRRAIRARETWINQQNYMAALAEQQRKDAEFQLRQQGEARLQRDQDLRFKEAQIAEESAKTEQDRKNRVLNEAGLIIDSIKGSVDSNGKVVARPIRPEDDDAIERLDNLFGGFKFGIENKAAAEMFTSVYNDALKFKQDKINQSKQQELAAVNLSVRTGKPFEEFGTYDERGLFQPKAQGMIAGAEEVKAAEEAKQEAAAIAREGRGEEARVKAREESDKRTRRRQLDEDILTEEQILIDYQNQNKSPSRDVEIKKSRAKLLNLGLKRAAIDDLAFKDQDAYKKALQEGRKIPSGTTIYIGTKPVKVK